MRSNSIIFSLLLVVVGSLFVPVESGAQAVPPRSQTLQLIRPITPPPTPPVQEEIGQVKKDVQTKTQALERKIGVTFPERQRIVPSDTQEPLPPPHRVLNDVALNDEIRQVEAAIATLAVRLRSLKQELKRRKGGKK
jgi:hypothetical protein